MSELTWGVILAGYLFLGGLAGGSYIVAAMVDLMNKKKFLVLSKSGFIASFISIIIGLVLLVFDLKRFREDPMVLLNAYSNFPRSIMSVGTWIITAFTIVSLVTLILTYLNDNTTLRKLVEIVGIVLGFSTAAYTGILLSFSRGVQFWQSAFLPWLFILSGLLTGLAIAVILIPLIGELMPKLFTGFSNSWENMIHFGELVVFTDKYAQSLTVIEFIVMLLYFLTTPATNGIWIGSSVTGYFYTYILLALVFPFAITMYNTRLHQENKIRFMSYMTLAATLLALIGGFLLRYVVLIGGQLI
jgi:formate-dependent nitrite reductase membrane component NrfD